MLFSDHNNFQSAIDVFREIDQELNNDALVGFIEMPIYIVMDFPIPKVISLDGFKIMPSSTVSLCSSAPYRSYVSKIEPPSWLGRLKRSGVSASFGLAVSALVSFVTKRQVKVFRNSSSPVVNLEDIGIHLPVLFAGTGGNSYDEKEIDLCCTEIVELYKLLQELDVENYRYLMQSMRLFQLALLNKQEDFNLAFSLLVASIESTATKAISAEDVDPEFNNKKEKCLAYSDEVGLDRNKLIQILKDSALAKRFVKFIFDYAPPRTWLGINDFYDRFKGQIDEDIIALMGKHLNGMDYHIRNMLCNDDVIDANIDELKKLIQITYSYRSNFFHRGEATPHNNPNTRSVFFEEIHSNNKLASITKNELEGLGFDVDEIWGKLVRKNYINKNGGINENKFDEFVDFMRISGISEDQKREIRQVFYRNRIKIDMVATFTMISHIGKIAITEYFRKQ